MMALTACVGGFFGVHNFLLSNNVSGSIKIYLTLVALISPYRIGLCIAIVDFAWIIFDLWQICYVNSLPEVRFVGSKKKASLIVLAYLAVVAVVAVTLLRYFG